MVTPAAGAGTLADPAGAAGPAGRTGPVAVGTTVAVASVVGRAGARGPLRRVRTVLLHPITGRPAVDEHVRVRLTARDDARAPLADVLVAYGTGERAVAELALAHPGALVVAVHRGARCRLRLAPDGTVLHLEADAGERNPEQLWEGLASLAHSWLTAGVPGAALRSVRRFVVQLGDGAPPRDPSADASSSRASRNRVASASSVPDRPTEV